VRTKENGELHMILTYLLGSAEPPNSFLKKEMEVKKVRAHVLIKGRVQGVFFRAETLSQAYSLGLTGWVRNRWGGSVEAVFEGEDQKVRKMIAWCYKGPPSAVVEDVEVEWEDYKGEFASFSVRY